MAAITTVQTTQSAPASGTAKARFWDFALCMHLAAGRFGSPAGMAFLPQSYLPFLSTRKN